MKRFTHLVCLGILFVLAGAALAQVQNPSFEDTSGWDKTNAQRSFKPDGATPPRSGERVALVGSWGNGAGQYMTQTTEMAIEPGVKYTLSAWFAPRLDVPGETHFGGIQLRIIARCEKGRYAVALLREKPNPTTWEKHSLVFEAPLDLTQVPELHGITGAATGKKVDITGATIEILVGKFIGYGDAYYQTCIDDVKLWKGDEEPADPEILAAGEKKPRDLSLLFPDADAIAAKDMNLKKLNPRFPTPGRNSYDSMPLGNGETAANVWADEKGGIHFYLSRTDAWSGIGRLLKVGRVRLEVTPNPFEKNFMQELDLETASIVLQGANGFEARFYVDANLDVMRVKMEADAPFKVKSWTDPWRLERRALEPGERHSAYPMIGGPEKYMIQEPDRVLPAEDNQVVWYHRNGMSPYGVTLKNQKLDDFLERTEDPYLNRTFGGLMEGTGLESSDDKTLVTPSPVQNFELRVFTHTSQPEKLETWLDEIRHRAYAAPDFERAWKAHTAWWKDFWDRSYIYASGPKPPTFQASAIALDGRKILRIGADARDMMRFKGRIARASVFSETFSAKDVAKMAETKTSADLGGLAQSFYESYELGRLADGHVANMGSHPGHRPPLVVKGKVELVDDSEFGQVAELNGDGFFETARQIVQPNTGGTWEAWIWPDPDGGDGGRIFDQAAPDMQLGYFMDTLPNGTSLRSNRYDCTNANLGVLRPGEWQHVAMVFDQQYGQVVSYVDGKEVGRATFKDVHESKPATAPGIFHLSQGYALQRFVNACAGRGNYPIKFNGSLFTMEGEPVQWLSGFYDHNADFRMWGPDYWFQNTRLPYWSMVAAGDFDLMDGLCDFYLRLIPIARERTRIYFDHDGAYWPETITLYGTFNNNNYGWNRDGSLPDGLSVNKHIRLYYSGALELLMMMFDRYAITKDADFARDKILPLAIEVIKFYDLHYDRGPEGKLRITPAQALETYNVDFGCVNPAPPVAGLKAITTRLLNDLPEGMAPPEESQRWERFIDEIPPVPYSAELDVLMISENKDRYMHTRGNGECPELYPVFPYRLYSIGTDGEEVGRNTFKRLPGYYTGGWNQDATNAAMVGDVDRAAAFTYWNFATWNSQSRFPGFWGANYDWVPDQDHGGTAMIALQRMLLQDGGEKILLLPAWPKEWDVRFKLHAPQNTVVEMEVRAGKLVTLEVTPQARRKDCVLPDWLNGERETWRSLPAEYRWEDKNSVARTGPDMFFSMEDLPALQKKTQTGRAKELMEMLRVTAERFMEVETRPYDSDGPYIGRNMQAQIGVLAFVGLMDDNPAFTEKAREILMASVEQYGIQTYVQANGHLAVGDGAAALSVAYDFLRGTLSAEEQEKVRALLRDMLDFLYDSSVNRKPHSYQPAHNHSVVAHNGLLLAAHILGERDKAEYAIPWIRKYLSFFQDGSGAPYEGAGYAEYGMIHAFMANDLLRRHYNLDLLAEVPGLTRLPRYHLNLLQPWSAGLIPLNQTGSSLASAAGFYHISNRTRDQAALYVWGKLLGEKGIAGLAETGHPSHISMFPFLVIWTDDSIEPTGPEDTGAPLFATFDRGIVAARTEWGNPNAGLFTFNCSKLPHLGIWDHADENSFTFTAFGDNLILDPGPHMWKADNHSQILIDGTAMNFFEPGHRSEGNLEKAEDRGHSVYVVGDAAHAYSQDSYRKPMGREVERAERRILFVRASRPFLVVEDRLTLGAGKEHDFTLRTVCSSQASHDVNAIAIAENRTIVTGGRNGAVATVDYLIPESLDLRVVKLEGNERSARAVDAAAPRSRAAHFRTVITSAPAGGQPAEVQMEGNTLSIRLEDGESWTVQITDENISAEKE